MIVYDLRLRYERLVLEPIFEIDFKEGSYGYLPGRSATQALEAIESLAHGIVIVETR